MNRLRDKKALVIGASTGIGREVCRLFAQEGADVAIADFGHAADEGEACSTNSRRSVGEPSPSMLTSWSRSKSRRD